MIRQILHVDLDAFFVSVEQALRPSLKGKPVIVGGNPPRGVVASASYEARAQGVRAGMPLSRAHRLCPQAISLQVDFPRYRQVSEKFMNILADFSPYIEPVGLDEAYLDVTGSGSATEIASILKSRIKSELALTATVGIACCKVVAKIASGLAKPDGLLEVKPGKERGFLAPLLVARLPGVGKKTGQILRGMGVVTIGQLAALPLPLLRHTFGISGETLYRYANGIDQSEVEPPSPAKSISRETTFAEDTLDFSLLEAMLGCLSERVGDELRCQNRRARCITLKLKYADFKEITRSHILKVACQADQVIFEIGLGLLEKALAKSHKPVRLIGIKVSNLVGEEPQLSMLDSATEKLEKLDHVIDHIRRRYGYSLIQRGRTLSFNRLLPKWR